MKYQGLMTICLVALLTTQLFSQEVIPGGGPPTVPDENEAVANVVFRSFTEVEERTQQPDKKDQLLFPESVKKDERGQLLLMEGQKIIVSTDQLIRSINTYGDGRINVRMDDQGRLCIDADYAGTCNLDITFKDGSQKIFPFLIGVNYGEFERLVKRLFPTAELEIVPIQREAMFLRGTAMTEEEAEQIVAIAEEFWPTVHNYIKPKQGTNDLGRRALPPGLDVHQSDNSDSTLTWSLPGAQITLPGLPHIPVGGSGPGVIDSRNRPSNSGGLGGIIPNATAPVQILPQSLPGAIRPNAENGPGLAHPLPKQQSPAKELHNDIKALHQDVKELIRLLKEEAKPAAPGPVSQMTAIPEHGEVFLFFQAPWCGPCQQMQPVIAALAKEGHQIVSINIEGAPALAQKHHVDRIPMFVRVVAGKSTATDSLTGVQTKEALRKWMEAAPDEKAEDSILSTQKKPAVRFGDNVVKVRVQYEVHEDFPVSAVTGDRIDMGTGVVIRSEGTNAYILTAAHLFKQKTEWREIHIEPFRSDGTNAHYFGTVLVKDDEADLAIVKISGVNNGEFKKIELANADAKVALDTSVIIAGIEQSSRELTTFTGNIGSVDKYAGPGNFQVPGVVPLPGMAGAPVFNRSGQLVGAVVASDPQAKETVCTSVSGMGKLVDSMPNKDLQLNTKVFSLNVGITR